MLNLSKKPKTLGDYFVTSWRTKLGCWIMGIDWRCYPKDTYPCPETPPPPPGHFWTERAFYVTTQSGRREQIHLERHKSLMRLWEKMQNFIGEPVSSMTFEIGSQKKADRVA